MKNIDFLKQNIIAHRGVHINEPENSLEAFKEAIKNNYIIELDVHLLKDNKVIVFHDDNLIRMTNIDKKLKDCTYKDIKDLKLLNSKSKIPTLQEVLNLIKGKVPVVVELKYDRKTGLLEKEVCKLLDNYNGEFCVQSFSPFIINWFRKNKPEYIRGLLISNGTSLKEKISRSKLSINICNPDFISCNYHLYNKLAKYMKKIPVIAWTIKNKVKYSKYKDQFYNLIVDVYKEDV